MSEITLEQTVELYEFLQGTPPKCIFLKEKPELTKKIAFNVIWYLQEHLRIVPDNYDFCTRCEELYDADWGGQHFDDPGINLCEGCMDMVFYRETSKDVKTIEEAVKEWYKSRGRASAKEGSLILNRPP